MRKEFLSGQRIAVIGGGINGLAITWLASKAGANVRLVGRSMEKAEKISAICNDRYQSKNVSPGVDADKQTYLKDADIPSIFGSAL